MSKLEQKLIELGYVKYQENIYKTEFFYLRLFEEFHTLHINVKKDGSITHAYVKCSDVVDCQQDIDNVQKSFNQLQKDLEVLKDVKD